MVQPGRRIGLGWRGTICSGAGCVTVSEWHTKACLCQPSNHQCSAVGPSLRCACFTVRDHRTTVPAQRKRATLAISPDERNHRLKCRKCGTSARLMTGCSRRCACTGLGAYAGVGRRWLLRFLLATHRRNPASACTTPTGSRGGSMNTAARGVLTIAAPMFLSSALLLAYTPSWRKSAPLSRLQATDRS
jgi:hypothetical protein